VYFPPTDLLNYGTEGVTMGEYARAQFADQARHGFDAALDFHRWDEGLCRRVPVTEPAERQAILRDNSPLTHVSQDTPPTLLLHGDRDAVVPLQQSQRLVSRLAELDVTHRLIVIPGLAHEMPAPAECRAAQIAAWFDSHL